MAKLHDPGQILRAGEVRADQKKPALINSTLKFTGKQVGLNIDSCDGHALLQEGLDDGGAYSTGSPGYNG